MSFIDDRPVVRNTSREKAVQYCHLTEVELYREDCELAKIVHKAQLNRRSLEEHPQYFSYLYDYPIWHVERFYEQLWRGLLYHGTPELNMDAIRCIATVLQFRRSEWRKDYIKQRREQYRDYYLLWNKNTCSKWLESEARRNANHSKKVMPMWWVTERRMLYGKAELKDMQAYYEDQWTWDDPSQLNRELMFHCEMAANGRTGENDWWCAWTAKWWDYYGQS